MKRKTNHVVQADQFYPLNKEKLPEADVLADKLAEAEFTRCQGLIDPAKALRTGFVLSRTSFSLPTYFARRPEKRRKSPACRRHPRYSGREGGGN